MNKRDFNLFLYAQQLKDYNHEIVEEACNV